MELLAADGEPTTSDMACPRKMLKPALLSRDEAHNVPSAGAEWGPDRIEKALLSDVC